MQAKSDAELLHEYADQANEAAFRAVVSHPGDLVYASALRQVSSPDLVRDIAQSVFTDLARKAPLKRRESCLPSSRFVGFLHQR